MKKSHIFAATLAALLPALPAFAHEHGTHAAAPVSAEAVKLGDLAISGGFSRATLPNAPVAGGYLSITNGGHADDRLVSASADFAKKTEIHEMKMEGDVMKMQALPDGVALPAGATVDLKPGGNHIMFMGLKHPLKEGETVNVTLTFEKAGEVSVPLQVGPINAKSPGADAHSGH